MVGAELLVGHAVHRSHLECLLGCVLLPDGQEVLAVGAPGSVEEDEPVAVADQLGEVGVGEVDWVARLGCNTL